MFYLLQRSVTLLTTALFPHFFFVFTNTNWKGKLCWKAIWTADSHAHVWLSTFSLWNNGVYPTGYKASTWNKTRMINNCNNWTIFGEFCYIIAVIMSTIESDYLTIAIWRSFLFHFVVKLLYESMMSHINAQEGDA